MDHYLVTMKYSMQKVTKDSSKFIKKVKKASHNLVQVSGKHLSNKHHLTCDGKDSGKVFRCFSAVKCCHGLAKIYEARKPGIVKCRPTSLLAKRKYKECKGSSHPSSDFHSMTFEHSLDSQSSFSSWRQEEDNHFLNIRKSKLKRENLVNAYFKARHFVVIHRRILTKANRRLHKAENKVHAA